MHLVIRLTEVELTTGSIIIEEPTVWARVWISAGLFFNSKDNVKVLLWTFVSVEKNV